MQSWVVSRETYSRAVDGEIVVRSSKTITFSELDAMLREWGRWSSTVGGPIGPRQPGCGSAESAYRSPQHYHAEEPKADPPDGLLAEKIEAQWRKLDPRARKVLACWYVWLRFADHDHQRHLDEQELLRLAARKTHVGSGERFQILLDHARREILAHLLYAR